MDAKRIKLDGDDEDSRDSSSRSSCGGSEATSSPSTSTRVTVDDLKSADPLVIEKALKKLKGTLRNKAAIVKFMTVRSSEVFPMLIALLNKAATDIPNKPPPWNSILKETISVIANCCNYSVAACLKMTAPKITHIAGSFFLEPAACIASNPSLVDRLVLMLEPDDNAATQALRAVRGLVSCTYMK
ncbi:hypothetical protein OSTOST_04293, partial [Ostertagia ostertagi]